MDTSLRVVNLGMMVRCTIASVLLLVMIGCGRDEQESEQFGPETELSERTEGEMLEDAALRRTYGPSDMRIHDCVKLQADGTIVGEKCPAGALLFGPYFTAPASSDLRLTFDIESSSKLIVSTDLVSAQAKNFHGATETQDLEPNERRRLGYRIHMFQTANGVETRLWMGGKTPTSFKITNFVLEVN